MLRAFRHRRRFRAERGGNSRFLEQANVVLAVTHRQHLIRTDANLFHVMMKKIYFAVFMQLATFWMRHRGSQRDPARSLARAKTHQMGEAEVGEDTAANDFRSSMKTVRDDTHLKTGFAQTHDGFSGSGDQRHGPGRLLENLARHAGKNRSDFSRPIIGSKVRPIQELT